jgi:hypothetical protein
MKTWIGVALCLIPFCVHAEQTYTNEDLKKFTVPGAYTNQDLKKLPKLPVMKAVPQAPAPAPVVTPNAEPFQLRLDFLAEQRLMVQTELNWREEMVEKAYSYIDKGPQGGPWPGYLSKSKGALSYLRMQLAIVDARIEKAHDEARRAGVILEER